MAGVPFTRQTQLCHTLVISKPHGILRTPSKSHKKTLPGQPRFAITDPNLHTHLQGELLTPDLNRLAPYLWMVATQNSSHISTLTHQAVRGRSIIITDNPELHLVWFSDKVFIKPIPKYLLSFEFWKYYLDGSSSDEIMPRETRQALIAATKGFVRSYSYLVRSKSDFRIARGENDQTKRLIPENITFTQFTTFISSFEHLDDEEISPRYHFGELRLSRLNFWAKIVLRKLHFQKVHDQYGSYFMKFYVPIAVMFAFFSIVLNAMQVVLAAESLLGNQSKWVAFVSRGFSVFILSSTAAICLMLLFLFLGLLFRELLFAGSDLSRRRLKRTTPQQQHERDC